MIKHKFIYEIDMYAAIFGIIFSLVLTLWFSLRTVNLLWITVGVLFFISCSSYLIMRNKISFDTITFLSSLKSSSKTHFLLNLIIFIFFTYSIFIFYLRPNLYIRPLKYFITIALITSLISIKILLLPYNKSRLYLVLFQIILIASSLEISQLIIYPSIVGQDPWWHHMFTLKILNLGHIPEGYAYSKLAFMHLLISSTMLLTGLSYKISTIISVSLIQIISNVLFIFLIGNNLFNYKVGLLSSLLLVVGNYHIMIGFLSIPNTMASLFIPPVIYLLFKRNKERHLIDLSLIYILFGVLILTHTVTSVWMAIILITLWAGFKIYNIIYHSQSSLMTINMPILFLIGMFSWWSYASGHMLFLGRLIKWGFSRDFWFGSAPLRVEILIRNVPFIEILFNNIGMYLYFAISFIGCFFMISKKFRDPNHFTMTISGIATFSIIFISILFNRFIITGRWFYFSQIILSLPLALSLILSCSLIKNKLGKYIFLSVLTFSLSFFMILSPIANLDNSIFSHNTQVRYAFTESELRAIDTVSKIGNNTIGVDSYYALLRYSTDSVKFSLINSQLYSRNFTDARDLLILIREEIVIHPFIQFRAINTLDYDPRKALIEQVFSKVYDCYYVSGFFVAH